MPRPLDVGISLQEDGNRIDLAHETRHLHGTIESPWWTKFSWWVIPEGLFLLISPWIMINTGYVPPTWVFLLVIAIFAIPPVIVFRNRIPMAVMTLIPILMVFSLVLAFNSSPEEDYKPVGQETITQTQQPSPLSGNESTIYKFRLPE